MCFCNCLLLFFFIAASSETNAHCGKMSTNTQRRIDQLLRFTVPELEAAVQRAQAQVTIAESTAAQNPANAALNAQLRQAAATLAQSEAALADARAELVQLQEQEQQSSPLPGLPNELPPQPNTNTTAAPNSAPTQNTGTNSGDDSGGNTTSGTVAPTSSGEPSTIEKISDFFTEQAAGLPVWAWFLIGFAALALLIGLIAWGATASAANREAQAQLRGERTGLILSSRRGTAPASFESERYAAFA